MPDWSSWRSLEEGVYGSFSARYPKQRGVYQIAYKGKVLRRHNKYVGKATSIYARLYAHATNSDKQLIGEYIQMKGRHHFDARFAFLNDGIDSFTNKRLKGFERGTFGDYNISDQEAYIQWFGKMIVPWPQNQLNVRDETKNGQKSISWKRTKKKKKSRSRSRK